MLITSNSTIEEATKEYDEIKEYANKMTEMFKDKPELNAIINQKLTAIDEVYQQL